MQVHASVAQTYTHLDEYQSALRITMEGIVTYGNGYRPTGKILTYANEVVLLSAYLTNV